MFRHGERSKLVAVILLAVNGSKCDLAVEKCREQ